MKFERIKFEIKNGKKIKHKYWDKLIIINFNNKIYTLEDNKGLIYYFNENDFKKRFSILKEDWMIVNDNEYKEHLKEIENFNKKRKNNKILKFKRKKKK